MSLSNDKDNKSNNKGILCTSYIQDLKCEDGCQRIWNLSTQTVVVESPVKLEA